jgi:HAE1 family hydrophobic/amphiphilic exporter-1
MAFTKLPLRFLPEGLTENRIRMFIPVRLGMSPQEVEDKVVRPLEGLLRTIPGLKQIRSTAASNRAFVDIHLDEGMDPTLVSAEVRDRAQRAKLEWPPEVDRYFTWKEDASNVPLAFFQILTPQRTPEWDYLVDEVVRPRLESVDGVGRVEMWGMLAESIRIWFDRDKLNAHNVDFRGLIARLRADNFAEPLGELTNGSERFLLRADGKFTALQDIENFPVHAGLRVKDIARVERVPSVRERLARFNQKYTYSGMVRVAAGVNPVVASENLREAVTRLREDRRLVDLEFRFLFDQGQLITESLDTLVESALQGGALALVVLFLFLRHVRFTIAIALAIPLTMLAVGAWLFFTDDSLNVLTMAGMTLAIGMVVDNSVVVLDNIRRFRAQGMPLRGACILGAQELGLAITMATLTTVVVFMPMVFMSSQPQARVLMGSIGIPLSVALLASLFVALLLLPSGLRYLGGHRPSRAGTAQPSLWSPVQWLIGINQALLRFSLKHRVLATLLVLGLLTLGSLPGRWLDFDSGGGGAFRSGDVTVNLDLPRGMTLVDVDRQVKAYEDFVLARKAEWKVDSISTSFSRTFARVDIVLDQSVRKREFTRYRQMIEAAWPRYPGIKPILRNRGSDDSAGSEEKDERNFVVRLQGRDSVYLGGIAARLRDDLARLPTVESVEVPAMQDSDEIVLDLDRDRMQELKVHPEVLFGTVNAGLQGQLITRFEELGREVQVVAEFDRATNPTLLDLKDTRVWSDSGTFQRLENLGHVTFQRSLADIERVDGRTSVTIVGRRAEGVGPKAFSEDLQRTMRRVPLPRGYSWVEDSPFREQQEEMNELLQAGALSIALVFLLMGVLFESVILPAAILVTIPFAIFGGLWSLWIFHGSIDPVAIVGMILLAGVVVNNGIVLLDCIERMRRQGMHREQAILAGTRVRTRPILMTAMTTIVGLLPMAMFGDHTGQGISYVTMSIAVAGGLAFSTAFTAFAVPLVYTYLDDFALWLRRIWQGAVA